MAFVVLAQEALVLAQEVQEVLALEQGEQEVLDLEVKAVMGLVYQAF